MVKNSSTPIILIPVSTIYILIYIDYKKKKKYTFLYVITKKKKIPLGESIYNTLDGQQCSVRT